MLDTFRNAAKTWIVKLLFAILALGFVSWGVGDFTRNRALGTNPAIAVGSTDVSASEVEEEFKRDVERMQRQFGGRLTTDEARKLGFMDSTIQTITNRLLIDEATHQLGLTVSDAAVIRAVANDPSLKDEQGRVDRERLRAALARMGLTEQAFLKIERAEQTRNQLGRSLVSGVVAPATLVDAIVRRRFEQRAADTVTISDTAVAAPPAPTEAEIEAYYKANTARFMAPEYRALTVLLLRPANVEGEIQITEDDITQAYEQRAAEFNVPERRQASQILLTDEAQADQATQLIQAGRDFAVIAKTLNAQILDLGTVNQAELPQELAEPVFSSTAGAVVGPVKSDLGWHVIKVFRVIAGDIKPIATVKGQLIDGLRRQKAIDLLNALSGKVDDALGSGASIEEAAQRFGLKVVKLPAVDQKGQGTDRLPATDLPKSDTLLEVAFHTDQGTESQLTENGADGYFLVRVDGVTPPTPRPLKAVSADASTALAALNRHKAAKEKADAIASQLKSGLPLAQLPKTPGITVKASASFTRDGKGAADVPPGLIGQLFEKTVGDVATSDTPSAWVVGRLTEIKPVDPAQRPDAVKTIRGELTQAVAGDIADEYLAALNAKFGVKIDRSQLVREE